MSRQITDPNRWDELRITLSVINSRYRFFASLLYRKMKLAIKYDVQTLATDGKTIWINPDYFNTLTPKQRVFAICHEIGHGIFLHLPMAREYTRRGTMNGLPFIPRLHNIATDFIINDFLVKGDVGEFRDEWLLSRKYTADTWTGEQVYADLFKQLPEPPPQGGSGGEGDPDGEGEGSGEGDPDGQDGQGQGQGGGVDQVARRASHVGANTVDEHIPPAAPADGEDPEAEANSWRQAVAQAASVAKQYGQLPGSFASIIDQMLKPKVDWREVIRLTVQGRFGRDDTSYARMRRRYLARPEPVYLPAPIGHGTGHLVAMVDTSGSVSDKELAMFAGGLADAMATAMPERLTVLFVDTRVAEVVELDDPSEIMDAEGSMRDAFARCKGRGGTSFEPGFEWIEENSETPDMVIYFTDGECYWPKRRELDLLWVFTQPGFNPDWGDHVVADLATAEEA